MNRMSRALAAGVSVGVILLLSFSSKAEAQQPATPASAQPASPPAAQPAQPAAQPAAPASTLKITPYGILYFNLFHDCLLYTSPSPRDS